MRIQKKFHVCESTRPGTLPGPLAVFWILIFSMAVLIPACQRPMAPEIPYDVPASESIRADLDQFSEPD